MTPHILALYCHLLGAQGYAVVTVVPVTTIVIANNGVSFKEEESCVWLYSNLLMLTKAPLIPLCSDTSSTPLRGSPEGSWGRAPLLGHGDQSPPSLSPLSLRNGYFFAWDSEGKWTGDVTWHDKADQSRQEKSVKSPLRERRERMNEKDI